MKKAFRQLALIGLLLFSANAKAQDPNFYIFLCLGQSNMEGYPGIPDADKGPINPRFQVLAAVDFPELKREKGHWYPAIPPLSRPGAGLSPADYFGRTLVSKLPTHIKVGVVNVAVGGCKIALFEKDICQSYVAAAPEWMKPALAAYDGAPYQRLIEMGKLAQKAGIIKGVLLHQGESNSGEADWPAKVKGVYENLLRELNLKADEVPLIVGEVLAADQNGKCAGMNPIIGTLPALIPTAHVVPSTGCAGLPDRLHFTPEGYRELGRRYAETILPFLGLPAAAPVSSATPSAPGSNPLFRDAFTADPAPLVVGDTLYLYVGHDDAHGDQMFNITEWLCYSSKDLQHWTAHGSVLKPTDFKWATGEAWASQVVEKGGKYYYYTTVQHGEPCVGKAIGVAVGDSPLGPFKDARGTALVRDDTTPSDKPWNDIDPTVFIDDDSTAYLAWGNPYLYFAKLKPNMIEIDGEIRRIELPYYTEGPWLHKRGNLYYLTYAAFAHQGKWEKICYATAPKITGPWTYRGILADQTKGSYTIHPGIAEFKGRSYLFYHTADLVLKGEAGGLGRRSVAVEHLEYYPDGSMKPVEQTAAGVSLPPRE
jgi:hypothetical protein